MPDRRWETEGRRRDGHRTGLFVESEGTFGVAGKIAARIVRKPEAVKTELAVFDEIDRASPPVSAIIARGWSLLTWR